VSRRSSAFNCFRVTRGITARKQPAWALAERSSRLGLVSEFAIGTRPTTSARRGIGFSLATQQATVGPRRPAVICLRSKPAASSYG